MAERDRIRQVHELDVRDARERVRAVCEQASSEWVPRNAIADALLLEYVDQATWMTPEPYLIERLEQVLSLLKRSRGPGTLQ